MRAAVTGVGDRLPRFAPPRLHVEELPGGVVELRSQTPLPDRHDMPVARLRSWALAAPDRPLLAERRGPGWTALTYAEADRLSDAVAAALAALPLGPERPILILSEPSCAQGVLRFAALKAGIPFVPVSPGLARWGGAARLAALLARIGPGLLALSPEAASQIAPDALPAGIPVWSLDPDFATALPPATSRLPDPAEDAVAAVFMTSGSTGEPKGVVVTHRMIAANQEAYGAVWPFLRQAPPIILDWLPWHHTFGGNDNLHKALWFGGTYYIDDGQPTPERFGRSLENVGLVSPTIHLNVPRGLALLVERLESDRHLRTRFFARLDAIFFAGAGLSDDLWRRLTRIVAVASERTGRETALVTGYGTTEAGSTICLVHAPIDGPRIVGLPIPGLTMRLVPEAEKREVRVRGPTVTPGYWRDPVRSAALFDGDGFLRTGDAARFRDAADPARGLVFDGRTGEDFKLSSGTWVSVGPLRLALLAAVPDGVRDVLVAGQDRERLGLVVLADPATASAPSFRCGIAAALDRHNAASPGSSTAIAAAIVDAAPLSPASGEVSDKGSLNQRLALANRRDLVDKLFAMPPHPDLILPSRDPP